MRYRNIIIISDVNMKKENIEKIVIEKLSQLENGELEKSPCGKGLALLIEKTPMFVKIYEKYKRDKL